MAEICPLSKHSRALTHLNAVVVEIRDDDVAQGVDGDVVRPGQVVRLAAARAELREEFPVELKDVDARGLVVHHDQVPRGVDRDPLRPEQLPAADATHEFS